MMLLLTTTDPCSTHLFLPQLLFFAIVLGLKGFRNNGFDTAIPPLNLDIKQSAINLVVSEKAKSLAARGRT